MPEEPSTQPTNYPPAPGAAPQPSGQPAYGAVPQSPYGRPAQPQPQPQPQAPQQPYQPHLPQPQPIGAPQSFSAGPQPPVKKRRRGLVAGFVVAGVAVLLIGGGAAAYNMWYQNPDKVITDAIIGAASAETLTYTGSVEMEYNGSEMSSDFSKVKVEVDGKNTSGAGELNAKVTMAYDDNNNFTVSGSALFDKDANLYVKANDLKATIEQLEEQGAEVPSSFDSLIAKLDGNWVKISSDDMKENSKDFAEAQECTKSVFDKLESDKGMQQEVVNLYKANKFIMIAEKLGTEGGSLGYVVELDKDKTKAFTTAFNDTALAKEFKACNDDFALDESDIDKLQNDTDVTTRAEVWIDRWSHSFTKVRYTYSDAETKAEAVLEPTFNQSVVVEAPADAISVSEVIKDFEAAVDGAFQSSSDDESLDDYDELYPAGSASRVEFS